jgi:catechol 2,3-dioxygenase-like lactoylglutathione lyase family enzyme
VCGGRTHDPEMMVAVLVERGTRDRGHILTSNCGSLGPMAVIERLDFLGVPTQNPERSRAFYRDVLGLRPDEHAEWEQWAGDTCFGIWEPEKQGMPFVAQKGNPWPLRCDDVAEMRAELEAKGVRFFGDTLDTGVCHMAIFADPDGNELMLHRRYAPYE